MNRIRHLQQTRPRNCGQTCVAMATGADLALVERWAHTGGRTSGADLRTLLWRAKVGSLEPKRIRGRLYFVNLPEKAILRVHWGRDQEDGGGHWVLSAGFWVHDPALDHPQTHDQFHASLAKRSARVTSYIEITERQ